MSEFTILPTVPPQLRGRGHNRCVPMRCTCGCEFLFGLSDGTEKQIEQFDQIDIRCPGCRGIASEPTARLRDRTNVHDGQSGRPESGGLVG